MQSDWLKRLAFIAPCALMVHMECVDPEAFDLGGGVPFAGVCAPGHPNCQDTVVVGGDGDSGLVFHRGPTEDPEASLR